MIFVIWSLVRIKSHLFSRDRNVRRRIFHRRNFRRRIFLLDGFFTVRRFRRTKFSPSGFFAVRNFRRIVSIEGFMVFSSFVKLIFSSAKQSHPSMVQWENWTYYEFKNDLVFIRISVFCLRMVLRYQHVYIYILKTLEGMKGYVEMWLNLNVHDVLFLV